ncbi:hypothetical protein GYMLUDRAFT_250715 [Collybiopsis luxurians FD-317 M1]|uniref:Uncharacterized protein n=1 Tax=Collybiopsis luxurians FD-317 M1 TaxID=944289 RepID=A0A0D0CDK8_9AGAR|nr:hypothetical protein GYMLUDRAFT_250715 [Collybiopsis luxurians FD-317 M1]
MQDLTLGAVFSVKDKTVLVTGGSRGIGKMIATGFVENGAKVYITARSQEDCEATAADLNDLGPGTCCPIPADLSKQTEVKRLVEELSKKENVLHVLINNAGTNWGGRIDEFPDTVFSKVMTLNLQRIFTLTQLCLPLLRAAALAGGIEGQAYKDPARVIHIASVNGIKVPVNETYAYTAAKAGLMQLSRHLAGYLAIDGITSNSIACGAFSTKMMAPLLKTLGEDAVLKQIPLSRVGSPEDIAGACIYLSSRAGAYISGATLAVDGGYLVCKPIIDTQVSAKL